MRAYLMGVLCAAFLCSVVNAITGESRGLRRVICGIFLALAIFHPLGSLDLPELSMEPFLRDAQDAVRSGTAQADAAKNEIITSALEAYILSKADGLGLSLRAELRLEPDGSPAAVTLTGAASPAEREALTGALMADLGLGREDVIWKAHSQSSE